MPPTIGSADGLLVSSRVHLQGDLRSARMVSMAELRAMPQREAEVTFECRKSGTRRHRFAGPLLADVATAAQPVFLHGERKDRLRFVVSILARDGHHVVLSWGEIDAEFGHNPVLLAVQRDGLDLDQEGPHLVVPGDVCGARNVSEVTGILVCCADNPSWAGQAG